MHKTIMMAIAIVMLAFNANAQYAFSTEAMLNSPSAKKVMAQAAEIEANKPAFTCRGSAKLCNQFNMLVEMGHEDAAYVLIVKANPAMKEALTLARPDLAHLFDERAALLKRYKDHGLEPPAHLLD